MTNAIEYQLNNKFEPMQNLHICTACHSVMLHMTEQPHAVQNSCR